MADSDAKEVILSTVKRGLECISLGGPDSIPWGLTDEQISSYGAIITEELCKILDVGPSTSRQLVPMLQTTMLSGEVSTFLEELRREPVLWLHVITKVLARETPSEYIQKREGPKKSQLTYVEGSYAVATLAALSKLGVMSSFEVVQTDVSQESVECLGKLTLKFYVNNSWAECTKMQWGGCLRQSGVPLGSTKKGAATDAMKKSLAAFGWALDVYTTEIEWHPSPDPEEMKSSQVQSFYDRAKEKGMIKEQAVDWCKEKSNGKAPEELSTADLAAMKRKLMKETD